nr:14821_t:CDS:2 [Entrophospora candida]
MEGNIPQCVRYIVQIIGWINNVASSDDINAKNKLLNLLIQVFKNFNTEVSTKSIVQDFTSTESIVEESSISSNNLIVPRPTLFLLRCPVPSTSNLTLPDLIVIQRRVLSDEEREILKKLDQHTESLLASFVEKLSMKLKNYSSSWT